MSAVLAVALAFQFRLRRRFSKIILETLPAHVSHGDALGGQRVGATRSGACQEARLMITGMSFRVPPR